MSDESDQKPYSDEEFDSDWSDDGLDVFDVNIEHASIDNTTTDSILKIEARPLSTQDLIKRQNSAAENVAGLLGISKSKAKLLLIGYKWRYDMLVERHMEDPNKVYDKCHVYSKSDGNFSFIKTAPSDFKCDICMESSKDGRIAGMPCGHFYCLSCYKSLLTMQILEEGKAASLTCPGIGCRLLLEEDLVKTIVSEDTYRKYSSYITRDYVRDTEFLAWCPAPNCEYAIECHVRKADLEICVPTVECHCGMKFCFGCGMDSHQPATCSIAQKWAEKNRDDSETANWIAANTRACPKCSASIEKNGGCNHMTCRKCTYHFCWLCMGEWGLHDSFFNCSRYDPKELKKQTTESERARSKLVRYLHYQNRYTNHLHSLNLDQKTLESVQKKMSDLQETADMSWIEVQFLNQAYESLKESRPTLAWSYAFAYYLKPDNLTKIFEDNQHDLEMAVENLSGLLEEPVTVLATSKLSLLDTISYVEQRKNILTEHALRGISEGTWEYLEEGRLEF